MTKPTICIVTFTDDRDVGLYSREVESGIRRKQQKLKAFLIENNITVVDPLGEIRKKNRVPYGVRNLRDIELVLRQLSQNPVDAAIIGAWNWSPPMLVMDFVRKLAKPVIYYTENDPLSGSLSQLSAASSSLMEWGVNEHALRHERCFGNKRQLLSWARAASAVSGLREGALLLWGGSYAVKMEQLQDDVPRLKSFMVRDILSEDQLVLVNRAEKILKEEPERIRAFIDWLKKNGLKFTYDEKMLTRKAFTKQAALLAAARDRLEELQQENIRGVSIKCQPEIYYEYGVDACTLPAFLPFAQDEKGEQKVYPTVCEGDIKGLLTSTLLYALNPGVPPAFGDLVSVEDDYIEFANCGAGSIFWAANTHEPQKALKNTEAVGNIHGVSGAAFNYFGIEAPAITVARLTRIGGEYYMQLGRGRALDAREVLRHKLGDKLEVHLGQAWGKIVVDLGVRAENFVKVIGANHLGATLGDFTEELSTACRMYGIPVVRIDSDEEMRDFYDLIRYRVGTLQPRRAL
jgi:L-fucose isomerase-like protein